MISFSKVVWFVSLAIVTCFSLLPGSPEPPPLPHLDKVQHFLAYGWLAFVQGCFLRSRFFAMAGFLVGWGVMLELLQGCIPHRFMSVADVVANSAGVLGGLILARYMVRRTGRSVAD